MRSDNWPGIKCKHTLLVAGELPVQLLSTAEGPSSKAVDPDCCRCVTQGRLQTLTLLLPQASGWKTQLIFRNITS